MNDYVIDASTLLFALAGKTDGGSVWRARLADVESHAPHFIDAAVGTSCAGMSGKVS